MSPSQEPTWNDLKVESWSELLSALHAPDIISAQLDGGHLRSPYMFRGQADVSWRLETKLQRLGTSPEDIEGPALRNFRKYAPVDTFAPESTWEALAVAQHNGLPTRLLDWTVSPLVAAHFATSDPAYKGHDGVIWCVNATTVRKKLLPPGIRSFLRAERAWIHDVRMLNRRYPTLRELDAAYTEDDVLFFLEPPSIDSRIANQFATLSMLNGPDKSHHDYLLEHSVGHPDLVRRLIIDRRAKSEIRDMLDQNNITERMLFPGLPGLCEWLQRYYGPA